MKSKSAINTPNGGTTTFPVHLIWDPLDGVTYGRCKKKNHDLAVCHWAKRNGEVAYFLFFNVFIHNRNYHQIAGLLSPIVAIGMKVSIRIYAKCRYKFQILNSFVPVKNTHCLLG